jgi:hypothetical protein
MSTKALMRKRTTNPEHNRQLKVAQFANPRKRSITKREANLARRVAGFNLSMATKNSESGGAQQRKETGGFHKPGAYK